MASDEDNGEPLKTTSSNDNRVGVRLPANSNYDKKIAWLNMCLAQFNQIPPENTSQTILFAVEFAYQIFLNYIDLRSKGIPTTKMEFNFAFLEQTPKLPADETHGII